MYSIYARPLQKTKTACFSSKWSNDLVTHVSAPLAWTVIICQPLIALPNNLEYFNLFHRRCLPSRLWSGNVCQITNNWKKKSSVLLEEGKCIELCTFRVHWNVLSDLCDTQCSTMTWMCLWCGKGIKNPSLPSLHQECVPPDFGFPVGFESGKTKRTKFIEFIWPTYSPSATVCRACS